MRYLLPASFLLALAIACGCVRLAARAPFLPAPQETVVPLRDLPSRWCETDDAHATRVIVTQLTIPHVFENKVDEICIARFPYVDVTGEEINGPMIFGIQCADGHSGNLGFGFSGGINVEDDDESIVLKIHYSWTTRDQVRGDLDQSVSVQVDCPADFKFPDGSQLHVTWRAASSPTTKPDPAE